MITKKEKCTGCYACVNKCPKECIKMKEDENGYIYPEIDENRCIHCNLCEKVCPSNNKVEFRYPKNCYAVYASDKNIRRNSASGGFATICAKQIIKSGGVVYGASFQNDNNVLVKHIRVENEKDLVLLQGSKYVHSYICKTYKEAEKDLELNKEVLFIGTPCQIAGLKKFLKHDYKKLYTIDLICHGVPSQKYLKDEIKKLVNKDIDNIVFRTEEGYVLNIYKDNKVILEKKEKDSTYYHGFLCSKIDRENCYKCMYAQPKRVSDITIGDFWGLDKKADIYDDENKGISVVLPLTEKGQQLLDNAKGYLRIEERNIQEAINGNAQLKGPSKKPFNYKKIKTIYKKKGYIEMGKVMFKQEEIKAKLKKFKIINRIYKKLKK